MNIETIDKIGFSVLASIVGVFLVIALASAGASVYGYVVEINKQVEEHCER